MSRWAVAACLLAAGCTCNDPPPPAASEALSPLKERGWLVELPVEGQPRARAAVPLGATEPRPVIIALHGGADRPEWQCGLWTAISGGRAFVLCPTGEPSPEAPGRFRWGDQAATEHRVRAALSALKRRYGDHVASGPVVLTGYGPGADRALALARKEPKFFSRIAVIEGQFSSFSAAHAGAYAQRGGQRALFACASQACSPTADRAALFYRRVGVDARSVRGDGSAPTINASLRAALAKQWPWLVEGAPGYAPP